MTETETPVRAPWWRRHLLVLVVTAVVVLAGAGVGAFLLLRSDDDGRQPLVDPEALVTARQEALNFFTLDYQHAEDDVDRVLALATGKFHDEYSASKPQLLAKMKAARIVCTAVIPQDGAALEFVHGGTAQVLVVVTVPKAATCGLFEPSNRTRVVLTRTGGDWRVSDLRQVG